MLVLPFFHTAIRLTTAPPPPTVAWIALKLDRKARVGLPQDGEGPQVVLGSTVVDGKNTAKEKQLEEQENSSGLPLGTIVLLFIHLCVSVTNKETPRTKRKKKMFKGFLFIFRAKKISTNTQLKPIIIIKD